MHAEIIRDDDGSFAYHLLDAEGGVLAKAGGFRTEADAEDAALKKLENALVDDLLEPVRQAVRDLNRAGGGLLSAELIEEPRHEGD